MWLASQPEVQTHEQLAQNCAAAAPWIEVNMATIQPHVLCSNLLISLRNISRNGKKKKANLFSSKLCSSETCAIYDLKAICHITKLSHTFLPEVHAK